MTSANEERAAQAAASGYNARASADIDVGAVTPVALAPSSPLARRAELTITPDPAAAGDLLLGVGREPTTTEWDEVVPPGESWCKPLAAGITVYGLSTSGTVRTHLYELGVTP